MWRLEKIFFPQQLNKIVIAAILLLFGCNNKNQLNYEPSYGENSALKKNVVEYIFAVHPLHNSRRMFEVYQPLVDYINNHTDKFVIKFEASTDYAHFEEKLLNRKFHFALPNPYQSVQATNYGYKIFGKMGDDERFCGIIVTLKENNINSVSDLKNSKISFPSATALAASMMPKFFLKTNGLDPEKEVECLYVGSQESSIMNVYLGQTKAGCTWPPPWESFVAAHPEIEKALEVKWRTVPLINNGLIVREDVPEENIEIFANLIYGLNEIPEGKEILKEINLSKFVRINQNEYINRVNSFVRKYEKAFGLLPKLGEKRK